MGLGQVVQVVGALIISPPPLFRHCDALTCMVGPCNDTTQKRLHFLQNGPKLVGLTDYPKTA
jgi:hypothetical protein